MPNWVYNRVSITGNKKALDRFVEVAGKENLFNKADENGEVRIFSYSNFLMPPKNKMREYHETNGWQEGKRTGDTEWNWYNWNLNNWGVKWDASRPELEHGDRQVVISWESPWGIPVGALEAMVQKFPTLEFDGRSQEEQGWGAEWFGQSGEFALTKEWDIPQSHEEWEAIDDTCAACSWDDAETWYDDCPGKAEAIKEQQEQQLEGAK
jgi:hypothetical protein